MSDIFRDTVLEKLGVRCVFPSTVHSAQQGSQFIARCMLEASPNAIVNGGKRLMYEDTTEDVVVILKVLQTDQNRNDERVSNARVSAVATFHR